MFNCAYNFEVFTVSFFGHRYIECFREIENRLEKLIIRLLQEHKYIEFLVGKNGEFDQIVSATIRRVKKEFRDDNSSHILILPYNSAQFQKNIENFTEYYDEIEICSESYSAHFKAAIQIRNNRVIDRSDLCVFFVEHNSGGAYQSMKYATQQKKQIINIAVGTFAE